jgi:Zn-dependent peptidase ImmA (M78 family)
MTDAQALWRDRGAPALGLRADTTVNVVFEEAAEAFHGLYDDSSGVIYINTALTDPQELQIVIAHELGHAFGLAHVTGRASVMNPGNVTVVPNEADQAALEALWGNCQ